MKIRSIIALCMLFCVASPAAFAQTASSRIAVANSSRILNEMQEFKEFKETMESEGALLGRAEKDKKDVLVKLETQRNQLKSDTPQWDELNNKFMDAFGEYQLWVQQEKIKIQRKQKRKIRELFSRIEKAIAEVAQRDGYDLVVADVRPELRENLDQVSLEALISSMMTLRNVLYAAPKIDISDAVIALLDSKFKSKGGDAAPAASGATPAPAARKAPAPRPAGEKP